MPKQEKNMRRKKKRFISDDFIWLLLLHAIFLFVSIRFVSKRALVSLFHFSFCFVCISISFIVANFVSHASSIFSQRLNICFWEIGIARDWKYFHFIVAFNIKSKNSSETIVSEFSGSFLCVCRSHKVNYEFWFYIWGIREMCMCVSYKPCSRWNMCLFERKYKS